MNVLVIAILDALAQALCLLRPHCPRTAVAIRWISLVVALGGVVLAWQGVSAIQ